jgi:hypothetical protein
MTLAFLLTPETSGFAPTVAPVVTGTLGLAGWYVGPATVTWIVKGNPVPTTSGCRRFVIASTAPHEYQGTTS